MEYRSNKQTGDKISVLGFGTSYIAQADEKDAIATIRQAYEGGVNYFDLATAESRTFPYFGAALGDVRKNVRYQIHFGANYQGGPYGFTLDAEAIKKSIHWQLEKLGTDYIDIYFAHAEDAGTPVEETLRAFDKLIRDGKVRCIGASNHQAWRLAEAELMARAAGLPHYVVLQQRFSYLQPVVGADFGTQLPLTPEQTDFCARHGVLLMAYSPLLGGLYEKPEIPVPVQYRSEHSDKLLELLRRRAVEWGYTPSQLVLGWMLALSPCVVPEVTASRLEHLEANLREVDPAHAAVFAEEVASVDSFTVKYS